MVARQLPRIGRGAGGGSTVAAASLAVEAAAWWKCNFSRSSSAFGNARQRGVSSSNNNALAAAAWRMLIIILIVTMRMIIDRGGGRGWGEVRHRRISCRFHHFFLTWCDKQCCQAQLHPSNREQWFFVWRSFIWRAYCHPNQWNTALMEAAKSCQKCKHQQSHFDFLNNAYWVSLF